MSAKPFRPTILLLFLTTLAGCGGGDAPAGQAGAAPPPMPVEVRKVTASPVEQTSEFMATLRSRRSTTIQPQVEGFLTRIAVRSGQEVSRGAVLFAVDSAPQQAALAALQSTRAMRDAELEYARQDAARTKTLYAAGAVSQRDMEQAETAQRTAEAALKAVDEQINQQKSQLNYYTINAPTAGMVGDIPVRQGDRVTTSTVLTTIHENDVLEIYINVPVQQAANLQVGLPVRIVDNQGQVLATNPITYVSPTVEPTQTVLAKALLVDGRGAFRSDQIVRTRIVWSSQPGVTIPVTSVVRINGQYFAYVVERNGDQVLARQKAVTVGDVISNEYVVLGGLAPGDELIVGGIQKIRDGAPVMIGAPQAPGAAGETPGKAS
jgi:RND family efflux transporter MFP subunit